MSGGGGSSSGAMYRLPPDPFTGLPLWTDTTENTSFTTPLTKNAIQRILYKSLCSALQNAAITSIDTEVILSS